MENRQKQEKHTSIKPPAYAKIVQTEYYEACFYCRGAVYLWQRQAFLYKSYPSATSFLCVET